MQINYVIHGMGNYPDLDTFQRTFPDAEILFVDENVYLGRCDFCSQAILAPDYNYGIECNMCKECYTDGNYYTDEQ
jgi:hypothetical protein